MVARRPIGGAPTRKLNLIMDSGAFSAWRLGKAIDLPTYCDFLLANLDWIDSYVALDVINPQDPEAAAAASLENLKYMLGRGLRPVPVYHVGEDISWLFRMLDLGCAHIGLSASSLVARNKVDEWYAMAWSHLVDAGGKPTVRAHAFGEGRQASLLPFPWYSADSTSWLYSAQRTGTVTLADGRKVVHRNDGAHSEAAQDIDQLPEHDKAAFAALLAEAGIDAAAFETRGAFPSTAARTYMTLLYFRAIQARVRAAQPIRYRPAGLFAPQPRPAPGRELPAFRMHLVIGENPIAAATVAFAGYENVLASYFYIQSEKARTALRDLVYDPVRLCAGNPAYAKTWDVLQRYIQPKDNAA